MAAEDVQRQIKIITTTRKKQAYMEVLEVANKMKKVQDLQQALRYVSVDTIGERAVDVRKWWYA
jgi:hypothetical protein